MKKSLNSLNPNQLDNFSSQPDSLRYTKQQTRNLLSKLGYSCGVMNNAVVVYASIDEFKPGHYDYLLSKGFVLRTDDVLGKWLEYPL